VSAQPCRGCPWNGGKGVVSSPERRHGAILGVVGEGPAEWETREGRCFAGPSGWEMDTTLGRVGLSRGEVAVTNAHECWRPDRASAASLARAVEACRGRVEEWFDAVQPKRVLLMGGSALRSVAPGFVSGATADGLMRHRGSLWLAHEVGAANTATTGQKGVLSRSVTGVMATIHPAAIIGRERLAGTAAMGYRLVPAIDLKRLMGEAFRAPIAWRIETPPWAREPFVFDVETDSDGRVNWVGVQRFSREPETVWCGPAATMLPWLEVAGRWPVTKVGHNIAGFDLFKLEEEGVRMEGPFLDTMVLGGTCEGDMARGLYYQAAYYGGHMRPFWKELAGGAKEGYEVKRRAALRRAWEETGLLPTMWSELDWEAAYNALDVDSTRLVALAQVDRARKEGWM